MAKTDPNILKRIERGRKRMESNSSRRKMCIEFVRGNQYLYEADGKVFDQRGFVRSEQNGRNRHKVRQTRNFIKPIIDEKVSATTSRVPAYEVLASSTDPEDLSAAALSDKILLGGYETWGLRKAVKKAIWFALVADEGFVMPYWDGNVGPFIDTEDGQVGLGEIRCRAFGGNQAYWEPGVEFEESPWHAFEYARPKEELENDPDFISTVVDGIKGGLKADASERSTGGKASKSKVGTELVLVTEYFERPCTKWPQGRHLVLANDREIFPEQTFPNKDEQGNVVDEPPFLRIAYTIDPDSDRDEGIVWHLIDPQRSANDGENKIHEWMNLALNPQIIDFNNSLQGQRGTTNPGDVFNVSTIAGLGQEPKWREVPSVPRELFDIKDRAVEDMRAMAHANDLPPSSISSGKEAQAIAEQTAISWSSFLVDVAELHGALGRRCLCIAQLNYTEDRILKYRGRVSWEDTGDFRGADIRGQTDVRVQVNSIEPRTRRSMEQKITNLAQMFPGYFPPEVIMSAMEGGNAEKLIETYELDVQRVASVIKKIRLGTLLSEPPRPTFPDEEFPNPDAIPETQMVQSQPDEWGQTQMIQQPTGQFVSATTGMPTNQFLTEVPGWMPRPFDGVPIHKATLADWMKSSDYEMLEDDQKEQAHIYYSALIDLESRAAERAAQQQAAQAEQLGMGNATKAPSQQMGSMPALPA